MISQKLIASARMLGVGLLAVAVSAPAALAGGKAAQCPFTSKDIDGWYKDIGFDTGADDAGSANVTCANHGSYVTLDEAEFRMGPKVIDGETVTKQSTFKHILVDLQATGGTEGLPKYTIELTRDGSPLPDLKALTDVDISDAVYDQCVSALLSSQAWNRWACSKQ